ncbi:MAG: electron transport complex subunit RsxE [Defluviitaleaceae bacterium]|nr:electron transport complex subunit RsxE [Defluviitaleaceae bacterium]
MEANADVNLAPKQDLNEVFLVGIIRENPVLVMLLSLCPILGVSSNFVNSVGMGVITGVVILFTNIMISLSGRFIPNEIRIPVIITIIATAVTIMEMLTNAFLPDLHAALGIFLPLIVVNCIVFGRAEGFALKNKLLPSILDALGITIGLVLAFGLMGFVRELLGTGAIGLLVLDLRIFPAEFAVPLFVMPAGAFIVLGVIVGIISTIKISKASKEKKNA